MSEEFFQDLFQKEQNKINSKLTEGKLNDILEKLQPEETIEGKLHSKRVEKM